MNQIGKNLKELREKKGLSIRALAVEIKISHNTLASYERYDIIPTVINAAKICEYFKVPIEYLVSGEKVITDFNDSKLLQLFKKIDSFKEADKELAKKFMKKLVKNVEEREGLEGEAE